MRKCFVTMLLLVGCGGPMLRNAPRPNPTYVAGGAAALASVLTLLDPDWAERNAKEEASSHPPTNETIIPADVLDRLDGR
jgi:hypothetical protein